MNGYTFRGSNYVIFILPLFKGDNFERKDFALVGANSLSVDPILEELCCTVKPSGSPKCCLHLKKNRRGKHGTLKEPKCGISVLAVNWCACMLVD